MKMISSTLILLAATLAVLSVTFGAPRAESRRQQQPPQRPGAEPRPARNAASPLSGVYRIDIGGSDKLYTVVAGASSNLPFGEQQRFFIDLAVRLTPPDLLALDVRGRRVTIGSSRAPRITLLADGLVKTERAADAHPVRSRVSLEGDRLTFTSSGRTEDNFSVVFASIEGGRRLRVTRRISAEQLNEPVVIQTFYNKIAEEAQWDIYGEAQAAREARDAREEVASEAAADARARRGPESDEAAALNDALGRWIAATNARDIETQMGFYAERVRAFYLARDVTRGFVRAEKTRVFASARTIDIRAEEPEIIFQEGGRVAVMRFHKTYRIEDGPRSRRGAVIQELRWRRTAGGWKIFSERDIRVVR